MSSYSHEAVREFVARVLQEAHHTAEDQGEPGEARAVLGVARMFADEMTAVDPGFGRLGFVTAATEEETS